MNDFWKQVSSYNLLNYLVPGAIFAALATYILGADLIVDNVIISLFVYYFIGMSISRFGSIVMEPVLQYLELAPKSDYQDYLFASEQDETLPTILEVNHVYRTMASTFLCLIFTRPYLWLYSKAETAEFRKYVFEGIGLSLLLVLFLLSHLKQNKYVTKRVEYQLSKKVEDSNGGPN